MNAVSNRKILADCQKGLKRPAPERGLPAKKKKEEKKDKKDKKDKKGEKKEKEEKEKKKKKEEGPLSKRKLKQKAFWASVKASAKQKEKKAEEKKDENLLILLEVFLEEDLPGPRSHR